MMSACLGFGIFTKVSADEVTATSFDFTMEDGASLKVCSFNEGVVSENALRFRTMLKKNDLPEGNGVKVVTIITLTEKLTANNLNSESGFTLENLDNNEIAYLPVVFSKANNNLTEIQVGDYYVFNACVYDVKAENVTKNFSARSYITDANGDITQYTDYDTINNSRSMWDLANVSKDKAGTTEETYGPKANMTEKDYLSSLCKTLEVTINVPDGTATQTVKYGQKISQYINAELGKKVAKVENFLYPSAYVDGEGRDCSNDVITTDIELTAEYEEDGIGAILIDGTTVTGAGSKFFDYTTEVVIPDTFGITEILASAFINRTKLTMIKMPTSVTKIGQEAFFGCKNLETVIMPGVTKITVNEGYSAENKVTSCRQFMNCFALKTVVVGESFELALVSVGTGDNRCFYVEGEGAVPNQVNLYLTSATGTATLHSEGSNVQNMLSKDRVYNLNLTENVICGTWRWVDGLPKMYAAHNYLNGVCLNCADEKVTAGLVYSKYDGKDEYYVSDYTGSDTEVYISSTYEGYPVTGIGKSAFFSSFDSNIKKKITKIVMPISVKTIHNDAFFNCKALETIIMPGVTELTTYSAETSAFGMIEKNQFYGCNKLTTIVAGASLDVLYGSGTTGGDQRVFWTDNYTGTGIDIYLTSSDGNLYVKAPSRCNMLTNVVYHYSNTRPTDEAKLATTWDYYNGVPTLWKDIPVAE